MNTLEAACRQCLHALLGTVRLRTAAKAQDEGYDLAADLPVRPKTELLVQLKQATTDAALRHALLQARDLKRRMGRPVLLFAPWIRDDFGETLRKEGLFYADTVGNAWITWPPNRLRIDIRGRRPAGRPRAEPGRLIEPTGLKIIHVLLTRAEAIHAPLRTIADLAKVALGTAAIVMHQLKAAGYVVPTGRRTRQLARKRDLFDLFVRGYALKLRPACFVGRYRFRETHPPAVIDRIRTILPPGTWALTGAAAAKALLEHLETDAVTLFVDAEARRLLAREPMLPDTAHGNLILLDWFAPTVADARRDTAPPLATIPLIYAELLADGRARELETAGMLLDRFWGDEVRT